MFAGAVARDNVREYLLPRTTPGRIVRGIELADIGLSGYENWQDYKDTDPEFRNEKMVAGTVVDTALSVGFTAGGTALGAGLGAMVGGPAGAFIGGRIGGFLGGAVGGWAADRVKESKWRDLAVDAIATRVSNQF